MQLKWLLVIALICCGLAHFVFAQCNQCAPNNWACVSENELQLCSNGVITGTNRTTCPSGQICDIRANCVSQTDANAIVACASCDTCVDGTFACVSREAFALCLGGDKPTNIRGVCDNGTFCNIDNPYICGTAEEGYPPSCSYTDDPVTTTTPAPATSPTAFCANIRQRGRFPVGSDPATTCKQYVQCTQRVDTWIGAVYLCPNNTYFNETSRACTDIQPTRCSSGVGSLSVRGFVLSLDP